MVEVVLAAGAIVVVLDPPPAAVVVVFVEPAVVLVVVEPGALLVVVGSLSPVRWTICVGLLQLWLTSLLREPSRWKDGSHAEEVPSGVQA